MQQVVFPLRLEHAIQAGFPGLFAHLAVAQPQSFNAFGDTLVEYAKQHPGTDLNALVDASPIVNAVHLWRQYRAVYRLDRTLVEELAAQASAASRDSSADLPGELLLNLPYPCIAVEGAPFVMHGDAGAITLTGSYMLWVDEMPDGKPCLHGIFEEPGGGVVNYLLPVGQTLADSIKLLNNFHRQNYADDVTEEATALEAAPILIAMQVVLYLQSQQPDIQHRPVGGGRKKSGKQPKPPKMYDVGIRIGSTIRAQRIIYDGKTGNSGGTRRAHTRRGHWHHFWTGPKDGERKLILKWLHPMLVSGTEAAETVIYPVVKGGSKT